MFLISGERYSCVAQGDRQIFVEHSSVETPSVYSQCEAPGPLCECRRRRRRPRRRCRPRRLGTRRRRPRACIWGACIWGAAAVASLAASSTRVQGCSLCVCVPARVLDRGYARNRYDEDACLTQIEFLFIPTRTRACPAPLALGGAARALLTASVRQVQKIIRRHHAPHKRTGRGAPHGRPTGTPHPRRRNRLPHTPGSPPSCPRICRVSSV